MTMKHTHNRMVAFAVFAMLAFGLHARQNVTYVEYVSSTGTVAGTASYVLLDNVKPTGKWKIKVDFSLAETRTMAVFSCKYRPADAKRLNLYNISGTYRLDMYGNRQHSTGAGVTVNLRQTIVYDAGRLYLDGVLITDASSENGLTTSENSVPIAIFGDPSTTSFGNCGKGSVFRVTMWDETGAKVCDLHPCLDSSGAGALYDSVNDALHYSLGAPFAAGSAISPNGVEFVEYVETKRNSDASIGQWFNTGVVPEFGGRIELDCTPFDRADKYYCLWNTHDGNSKRLSLVNIGNSGLRCDITSKDQTYRRGYNVRRTYTYDAGVFSVDGNVMKDSSAAISSLAPLNHELVLGASYDLYTTAMTPSYPSGTIASPDACNANFCTMRIYRFRYWNASGDLKLDMHPAKDASGVAALYDTVNGRFIYHSFGGTAYTASDYADYATLACGGAPVGTSDTVLEYVETEGNVDGGRQFFDTCFEPSGAAKFVMDVMPLQSSSATYAFFSDRPTYTSDGTQEKLNLYNIGNSGLRFDVNGTRYQTTFKPGANNRYEISYNAGVLKFGEDTIDRSAQAETMANSTNRIFLLASGRSGRPTLEQTADSNFAKARLYGMKIWDHDGGTLLRDFEPRLDASGVAGLYDKVGDKFYHSCSNEAVAGPRVGVPTQTQIDAASGVMDDAVFNEDGAKLSAHSAFVQSATGAVVCPYAGKTRTVDYAHFPQSFSTTASGGDTLVTATTGYASLGAPFASAAGTSWTAVVRVRREAKGLGALMDTVLSLGTECDKDRVQIGFSGTEATRRLDVRVGRHEWPELAGVLAPAGEWLDVAVVADASASSVRIALCRSGAEPVWMEKRFAVDGASLTNMAARATWNVKLGGVADAAAAEVGRISSEGKWTMFDEPLEAFKGDVQRVALWNRALSDAEVLAAFSQVPKTGLLIFVK